MPRSRPRAVASKQGLMADHSSQQPQLHNRTRPAVSCFLGSPRFTGFISKVHPESEPLLTPSPNSVLDSLKNPFWYDKYQLKSPLPSESESSKHKLDSAPIGLKLIDALDDDGVERSCSNPGSKRLLLGSKLRVQIPPLPAADSPRSPPDFGIKTRVSQASPLCPAKSGMQTKPLSVTEMELSEDYTCVIARGPNPRTTHIFDNCIVETSHSLSDNRTSPTQHYFLSFCYTCNNSLEHTKDIYVYRGEKAFCSRECRYREMIADGVDSSEYDSPFL